MFYGPDHDTYLCPCMPLNVCAVQWGRRLDWAGCSAQGPEGSDRQRGDDRRFGERVSLTSRE